MSAKSPVYPGTCLIAPAQDSPSSLRIKTNPVIISFADELQGKQSHQLASEHGDFIIKRKDHITAYQLAVVIDDDRQNISHIVRGYDLLDSTPKQIFLQKLLAYKTPQYCHFPVIIDKYGHKLSKQKCAQAVSTEQPQRTLYLLLELLHQKPPKQLKNASVQSIINWGIKHWDSSPLKNLHSVHN